MKSTDRISWRRVIEIVVIGLLMSSTHAATAIAQTVSGSSDQGNAVSSSQWQGSAPRQQQDFEARAGSIGALLQAYRNIASAAGNDGRVVAMQNEVAEALEKAEKQYQSGGYISGRKDLQRTYDTLKRAIIDLRDGDTLINRRAADEQYDIKKSEPGHLTEYTRLSNSLVTLMTALERVSKEKGRQQATRLQTDVAEVRVRADKLYRSGDHDSANRLLGGAYILVREALAAMREGDTLVQSLEFANKEEEYQYYLRKTQSQQEAIEILLSVSGDASKSKLINSLLQGTEKDLDEAGRLAANNDHEAAVDLMDKVFTRLQSGLMMSLSTR